MTVKKYAFLLALTASIPLTAACGKPEDPTAQASTSVAAEAGGSTPDGAHIAAGGADRQLMPSPTTAPATLSGRLDCLRETGAAVVIGHRGGPNRDFPENALETFARSRSAGALGMEIDIAESRDGVLFLMHDDDLDRTTTGEGPVADKSWSEIEKLELETYSTVTDFHPPTLDQALAWAVKNNVLVELDKKRSTSFDGIIDAVEANHAENNVFIVTYTDDQAVEVHQRSKDLVITATVGSVAQLDDLIARGVDPKRLVAWTGVERPDPALWTALNARGIESAFGTLGRRGERLDDVYWEDRNGSEYRDLTSAGLEIVVTDYSDRVSRELADLQVRAAACGF
ncbi:MAG: glycerophosphodiester phosphodiesterase family protein [Hyphomonadaceae bacterium]